MCNTITLFLAASSFRDYQLKNTCAERYIISSVVLIVFMSLFLRYAYLVFSHSVKCSDNLKFYESCLILLII